MSCFDTVHEQSKTFAEPEEGPPFDVGDFRHVSESRIFSSRATEPLEHLTLDQLCREEGTATRSKRLPMRFLSGVGIGNSLSSREAQSMKRPVSALSLASIDVLSSLKYLLWRGVVACR